MWAYRVLVSRANQLRVLLDVLSRTDTSESIFKMLVSVVTSCYGCSDT